MNGRIELAQVAQQPLYHLRLVRHASQHHKHRFEHVARTDAGFGPFDTLALEKTFHRKVEQPLLVAEQLIKRPFRNAQLLRDVVHTHRFDALGDEHLHSLFYNSFLLVHDPIRLIRMQI